MDKVNFEVLNVNLEGVNLIEASAGTGKTYSVAMLALRLVVEKKIGIDKILMVTFTNQAVAEMAGRIREFLRLALQRAEEKYIAEKNISALIDDRIAAGEDRQFLIGILKKALAGLDEASIQTIHSFCQDSLTTFAFETGQAYGLELKEDISEIIERYVQEFWRTQITGLDKIILLLSKKGISLKLLLEVSKNRLAGKSYIPPIEWDDKRKDELAEQYDLVKTHYKENIINYVKILTQIKIPYFNEKALLTVTSELSTLDGFIKFLSNPGPNGYTTKIFSEVLPEAKSLVDVFVGIKNLFIQSLYNRCAEYVYRQVNITVLDNHLLTYDDMINKLHAGVCENEKLGELLANKYEAIFIDEFQDTDRLQYEIYDQVYGDGKTLFYIGDPKQSIYGWRKADLTTYFRAAQKPGVKKFTMDTNYRSSDDYVKAMNSFFGSENPFLNEHIHYQNMGSKKDAKKGGIHKNGENIAPIHIFKSENKDNIKKEVAKLVDVLVHDSFYLEERLKKSDICILVRTKHEGKALKKLLANRGINAINIDDTKIFETLEAKDLYHILEGVLHPSPGNINKSLINGFTGFDGDDVLSLDEVALVEIFRKYQKTWVNSGVYAMFRQFLKDFNVNHHLQNPENHLGVRKLSNLHQLMEILQEKEYKQELKPNGLLAYLKKQISGGDNGDDIYLQRLESDEDAVTIMTIHKAKGLEFPVVIAPFLDIEASEKFDFSSYRDEAGEYCFYNNKLRDESCFEQFEQQLKEENRRLLYVAITRAKYNCFIFRLDGSRTRGRKTALKPFVDVLESNSVINISNFDWQIENQQPSIINNTSKTQEAIPLINDFHLPDANWRKMSFSFLTLHHAPVPKVFGSELSEDYDKFVFQTLPRGASLGDMLHYIFERVDFGQGAEWETVVRRSLQRYFPQHEEAYLTYLLDMVRQVTQTEIQVKDGAFTLADVDKKKLVAELEFDLPVAQLNTSKLYSIPSLEEGIQVGAKAGQELQGMLTGFVDLFFQHNGKYYILDWKSNYLGDQLEHYDQESMLQAMNDNNYHLQYLLYSFAIKQYLESRLPDFDYERDFGGVVYLFLRGVRIGGTTGIYTQRPSLEQVEYLERVFYTVKVVPGF